MRLVRTLQSDQDVEAIADYIAQDSPQAAFQWVCDIEEKLDAIAFSPGIGRERPDVQKGLRTIAFGNYLICYRQISGGVEILRVFHGARLWQDLL
jgi:toxin ParE1/3/4